MAVVNSRPRSVQRLTEHPLHKYTDPKDPRRLKKHDRRGLQFVDDAVAFAQRFTLDKEYAIEEFDEWAAERGLYHYPKELNNQEGHKTDAWKAMERRRQEKINGIVKAAETERMQAREVGSFSISRRHKWFTRILPGTRAVNMSIRIDKVADQTMRIRKHVQDALIAQDFETLPERYQDFVETLYTQMLRFERDIAEKAADHKDDFKTLLRLLGRDGHRGHISFDHPVMQSLVAAKLISSRPEDRHLYETRLLVDGRETRDEAKSYSDDDDEYC